MLTMPDVRCAWMLGGDVLNQGSTECNIHDLDAAANAECRDTALERRVEEIEFKLITIWINAIGRRVDIPVSVSHRIHVGSPTQEEAVDDFHELVNRIALRG